MTAIRWTLPAKEDFLGIIKWIAEQDPAAASRVGRRILASVERLARMPYRGRLGRAPDTRELVIPRLPYVVVYAIEPSVSSGPQIVAILRVLHGAMRWPTETEPELGFVTPK